MGKDEAIQALEDGYVRLRGRIAGLPDEAFAEVWLGTWDLSRLLAHMAGWCREMSAGLGRVQRGERPTPPGVDYSDPEPWNARFAQDAVPGRAALAGFDAAYEQYRGAALVLDAANYGIDPEKGRPRIGNRLLEGAGINHFAEHAAEVEGWLAART
jgi:hypothetical protein